MSWWILIVFLVAIVALLKFGHLTHRFKLLSILVIALFLFFTFSGVIHSRGIEVNSLSGMVVAGEAYLDWMKHVFTNTREIVGNVVRMDWTGLPEAGD